MHDVARSEELSLFAPQRGSHEDFELIAPTTSRFDSVTVYGLEFSNDIRKAFIIKHDGVDGSNTSENRVFTRANRLRILASYGLGRFADTGSELHEFVVAFAGFVDKLCKRER